MTRLDDVREVLWLEALSTAALQAAGERRAKLQAEAEAEYRTQGHAGNWKFPDIATVTLPVSKETPVVHDLSVFQKWVGQRYPGELEVITRVRESWLRNFLERVVFVEGEQVVMPGDGEIVPGLAVRRGGTPKALSIRAEPNAKAVLALHAGEGLKRMALDAGPSVPVIVAELEASNGE